MDYSNAYPLIFLALSIIPGLAWLLFFLKEDFRPEPVGMILKVFFIGALSTVPVIAASLRIGTFLLGTDLSAFAIKIAMVAVVAAVTEETAKYLTVRYSALKSSELDEPVDVMIYAITAALGFATAENLLFLFPIEIPFSIKEMAMESFFRFISGTFLHALVSGIMGYFLALSVMNAKRRNILVFAGLATAMLLHGLYNFSIIISEIEPSAALAVPVILLTLFIAVFLCFKKLRKMASICNLKNAFIEKK